VPVSPLLLDIEPLEGVFSPALLIPADDNFELSFLLNASDGL